MRQKGCEATHSKIKETENIARFGVLSHRLIDQIATTSKQKPILQGQEWWLTDIQPVWNPETSKRFWIPSSNPLCCAADSPADPLPLSLTWEYQQLVMSEWLGMQWCADDADNYHHRISLEPVLRPLTTRHLQRKFSESKFPMVWISI